MIITKTPFRMSFFGGGTEFFDDRAAAGGIHILRGEVIGNIDSEFMFGQIPDMPHGGDNIIVIAQHPADGTGFSRRFDDQQFLHNSTLFHILKVVYFIQI